MPYRLTLVSNFYLNLIVCNTLLLALCFRFKTSIYLILLATMINTISLKNIVAKNNEQLQLTVNNIRIIKKIRHMGLYKAYSNIGLIKLFSSKPLKENSEYLIAGSLKAINYQDFNALSGGYKAIFYIKSVQKIGTTKVSNIERSKRKLLDSKWINNLGLLLSLLFNDRSFMPEALLQMYKDIGILHLLAISGLHIMLAFYLGSYLTKNIYLRKLLGLSFALALCIQTNLPITAIRAFVMLLVWETLDLSGININSSRKLGLCCIVMPFLYPFCFLGMALWLSVLLVYFFINCRESNPVILQFKLFIYLIPINMFFFGSFSIYSIVANYVAIPFYSLFMPILYISYFYWLYSSDISALQLSGNLIEQLHQFLYQVLFH